MRAGSKVGAEEEVGARQVSRRARASKTCVIEMQCRNDRKADAYIRRQGRAPDACAPPAVTLVRPERIADLGRLRVLEHPGFRYGSSCPSVMCAGAALDDGEGQGVRQVDGIPGVGASRPFGIGPAFEQQSMGVGGSRGRRRRRSNVDAGEARPRRLLLPA
jgi:hypothetical protein